jgi:hypothetical protein
MTPEEAIPSHRPAPRGCLLTVWVIYRFPKDCPDGYVLRAQFAMPNNEILIDPIAWRASDPDQLRAILPPGLVKMLPAAGDDPVILETWI